MDFNFLRLYIVLMIFNHTKSTSST